MSLNLSALTKDEVDFYLERCNFTDEEEEIFLLRTRGKSIDSISVETNLCSRTIGRRLRDIKNKVQKVNKSHT